MANFPGLILTDAGRDILAKALAGDTLTFTRVALGDAPAPETPEALTALVNEVQSVAIQSLDAIGNGTSKIRAILTNVGLETGYFAREIGVYATDPDTLDEVLYSYANAGLQPDYIPAAGGATVIEHVFDLITVVDTAADVVAVIDESIIYATKDDITGVTLDGLTVVPPGSSNDYLITNYSSFSAYSVATDVGSVSISDDTITLVIDAGEPQGGINMTVTRDGRAQVFRLAVGAEIVAQPTIVAPADEQTDIPETPTLATSAFATFPNGADTHASTDWQVATDAGFTSVVFESLADAVNLTSISIPSGTLSVSTEYHVRARHNGTTLGASAYSPTITFTTADVFAPALEVAKLLASDGTSNDFFGEGVAMSGNYALVGAGGAPGGTAYFFERDGAGAWSQVTLAKASASSTDRNFGEAVDIDGTYAIIGDPGDSEVDDLGGAAYIFERGAGGGWTEAARLRPSAVGNRTRFGTSVSISGDYAIAGSNEDGTGSPIGAHIYERISGTWTEVAQVKVGFDIRSVSISGTFAALSTDGSGVFIFERVGGTWTEVATIADLGGTFGWSCALDNGRLIVSNYLDDSTATDSGAAYVYEHDGAGNWPNVATLKASDAGAGDNFGYSVAISGSLAIVGAYRDDNEGTDSGSAYLFDRDGGGTWSELGRIWASDGAAGDEFGISVAISGTYSIVGAHRDDDLGSNSGSAYIFE